MKQLSSAIEYVQRQKEHHRDGSANVWLERMTEQEDAPSGDPLQTRSSMNMVRETECEYRIDAPAVPFDAEPDWPDTLTDETFAAVAELTFGAP